MTGTLAAVPLITLDDRVAVLVDVVVWVVGGFGAGYLAHRQPLSRLARDGWITRLRDFERDGRWYERRLRIKRWKDRLPDAGAFFAGGFSKRRLPGAGRRDLERFVCETRRAELTHWWVMGLAPWMFLWSPLWVGAVMVGYALVANVPCVLVQRYNRARLQRALVRLNRPEAARR